MDPTQWVERRYKRRCRFGHLPQRVEAEDAFDELCYALYLINDPKIKSITGGIGLWDEGHEYRYLQYVAMSKYTLSRWQWESFRQ